MASTIPNKVKVAHYLRRLWDIRKPLPLRGLIAGNAEVVQAWGNCRATRPLTFASAIGLSLPVFLRFLEQFPRPAFRAAQPRLDPLQSSSVSTLATL